MPIQFVPFLPEHETAVRTFNQRMQDGKARTEFFLQEVAHARTAYGQAKHFVAMDGAEVRGGYLEVRFDVYAAAERKQTVNCQSPLSEGIVNPKYMMLPAQMFKHILKQDPYVFVVGMGSLANPLPRFLKGAGWSVSEVPFFFRVGRPDRFLRQMPMFQSPVWKRLAAQAGALSGMGSLAFWLIHRPAGLPAGDWQLMPGEWGSWCDALWDEYQPELTFGVRRHQQALRDLYPGTRDVAPLVLRRDGQIEGWSAVLLTQMQDHRNFGNLKVATILDTVARPKARVALMELTTRYLIDNGADLVITNQSHQTWRDAAVQAGFRAGPSNYIFAASPKLAAAWVGDPGGLDRVHVTRGDGDGRINL